MASGQTKFLLRLAILMSAINVILSYYLITTLEGENRLLGIPFATVTVTWLSMFVIMYQSISTLQLKISESYPWKKIATIIVLSLLSGIPVFALLSLNLSNFLLLITSSIIYGVTFLYTTFKFDIWGKTELKLFNSFWKLESR